MAVVLEARGLNKNFGAVTAAADINVAVERDSVVGLIGSNGAADHVHQHGHRLPEAQFRQHRLRKPRHHAASAAPDHAARHLPFVSDPAVVQHTVGV